MKRLKRMMMFILCLSVLLSGCGSRNAAVPSASSDAGSAEDDGFDVDFSFEPEPYVAPSGSTSPVSVKTSMFNAKFEGSSVSGKGEAVDGVYRFNATKTDGESWHVKLECNYPTVAGRDYRVTYRFHSDVAGNVKFGDFQEFPIHKGDNEVTGIMIANSGTSYLDLQLGMLDPFTIDFREIEVEEFSDDLAYENALKTPVNFKREIAVYERHDQGYAPLFERKEDSIKVYYLAAPWVPEIWKSRLYVNTGMVPEPGVRYRVTADIACNENMDFEVLFNDGDKEKGYGALYGQSMEANKTKRVEAVITGNGEGDELALQFSLGNAPEWSTVKLCNLKIDKIKDHYSTVLPGDFALDATALTGKMLVDTYPTGFRNIPLTGFSYSSVDTVYEGHDDGYVVNLYESADSATMRIAQAPANAGDRGVWKAKLYADTGVDLQAGKTYRISYDLSSEKDQAEYEACFDGNVENAYGALYGRSLSAGGTDHVEMVLTPQENRGPLKLRLQLGKTNTAEGNRVTLRNLKVEVLSVDYQPVETGSLDLGTRGNVTEEHYDGIEQEVSASGDTATLKVNTARNGGGVWSSKMLIRTGVTPEPFQKYQVSLNVGATAALGEFELLYQNGDGPALYTDQKGMTEPGTYNAAFVAPENGCGELVIVLQAGNTAAGNTITVNDIQVRKVDAGTTEDVALEGFEYPEAGEMSLVENSFVLETNNGAEAELTGDGESAKIKVTKPGDDWHIKAYAMTGLNLEAGETYTVSMKIDGAEGFPVCYKNGTNFEEEGFGTETAVKGTVTHTVTPETEGELQILLKLGALEADTEVSVSEVKITKAESGFIPVTLEGFRYPVSQPDPGQTIPNSFILEQNEGAEAELTGDGSSATAKVTKPGDDWHVKFYALTGLELEAGTTYRISMDVSGANGCKVCYKNGTNFQEEGFGTEFVGSNTVTHVVTPSENGKLEIILMIGNVAENTEVTVRNIAVSKAVPTYTDVIADPISYPDSFMLEANNGAEAEMSGEGGSATVKVTKPGDDWHVKFYIFPGTVLEAEKTYRISLRVQNASGQPVCYKNGTNFDEEGFGTEWIGSDDAVVTHTVTPSESGKLELLLKIGNVAENTEVTVSEVKVEEVGSSFSEVTLEGFKYPETPMGNTQANSFLLEAGEGAEAQLSGDGNSATAVVTRPGDDWHVKFYALTGLELQAEKTYKINFDVNGAAGHQVCYKNGTNFQEEGFGTETIPEGGTVTVSHTVTPAENGVLEIMLKIGNVAANTAVTVSNVQVFEYSENDVDVTPEEFDYPEYVEGPADYKSFDLEANEGSEAVLTGDGEKAIVKIVKPGDDWHIKAYALTGVVLEKGNTYTITMNVTGADGAQACYKNGTNFDETGFGSETIGSGTVTHVVEPAEDGELQILFKLGALEAGSEVTISDIAITKSSGEQPGENLMTDELTTGTRGTVELWTHEDYDGSVTADGDAAEAVLTRVPAQGREGWKTKLFLETGAKLEAGRNYRISADVSASADMDFEVCYNDGGAEAKLGSVFGQRATSAARTVVYECSAAEAADLVLQFNLGLASAPCTVKVSNIKVEEMVEGKSENVMPSFRYDSVGFFNYAADQGYEASLRRDQNADVFMIHKAPSGERKPWNVKLNVRTGLVPERGKAYRVTFDLNALKRQNVFEVFYDGNSEAAYGQKFGPGLSEGKNTVSQIVYGGDDLGELVLQIRLGETNGTDGNIYTFSNLVIEEITSWYYNETPERDAVTKLVVQDGYNEILTKTKDKANVRINKITTKEREAWKSKVFITTGVKVKQGEKYRVSMMVKSIIPAPFEVCINDGDEEKGLGAMYGLISKPAGQYVEYVTYAKKDANLVVQLSLGNCAPPNTIFISDFNVKKAGDISLVSDTIYTFE